MTEPRVIEIDGDVVRRPAKPWTATVHSLLRHLHGSGLPVPEPLDRDERFEWVRLLPGDGGDAAWPHQVGLEGVRSAARMLRRIHDATSGWAPPADAAWAVPAEGSEIIAHGDPKPGNMAWIDGRPVGLFDWDAARPADRMSDVAYALEYLVPFESAAGELAHRGFSAPPDRAARLDAFLDAYGWSAPFDVVDAVVRRQHQAIDEVVLAGAQGHEPEATWVAAGAPAQWTGKLATTRSLAPEISGSRWVATS